MRYRFGILELDTEAYTLTRSGPAVHVRPKIFDLSSLRSKVTCLLGDLLVSAQLQDSAAARFPGGCAKVLARWVPVCQVLPE